MAEPKALPPKLDLAAALKKHGVERAENLPDGPDKDMWVAYYAEKRRRKNLDDPTVAQEALDCVEWLEAQGRSPSELWTTYGYSPTGALKPAHQEETRIVQELQTKPSKDVSSSILDVAAVKTKHEIPEYKAGPVVVIE